MPNKILVAGALSLVGSLSMSGAALAGHCSSGANCDMGVKVINDHPARFGPMTVRNTPPMGHFRSIDFQRAPNVSITRVHGMMPNAGLSDAPSAFTKGCHPTSTAYCRQDVGTPVHVEMAPPPPPMPAPVFVAPAPAPAPIVQRPVQLRKWVGKGYDPSKFTPRTYGDATLVAGIAYVPTSKVVRDPAAAQAVLDSGRTVPQSTVLGGTAPTPSMVGAAPAYGAVTLPGTFSPSMSYGAVGSVGGASSYGAGSYGPVPPAVLSGPGVAYDGGAPQTILRETPGLPAMSPSYQGGNTYTSNIGPDGTYWEKTAGMTAFGSTVATQVICKRKVDQKVVNPVVGVPVPVPTPVHVPYCGTMPVPHAHGPQGHMAPKPPVTPGPFPASPGPWVY